MAKVRVRYLKSDSLPILVRGDDGKLETRHLRKGATLTIEEEKLPPDIQTKVALGYLKVERLS